MSSSRWSTRITLLNKVKDGRDEESWEDFVYYYHKFIYQIAVRMGLNHHDAEEVAQNVFLIAWKKLPEFEYDIGKGKFRGWLCKITGNEVKYFVRKKKKSVGTIEQEYNQDILEQLETFTLPEIEQIAEKEWKSHICRIAWENIEEKLPERVKSTYMLYLDGKKTPEIASELGITENTVYSYLKQARDKIKEEVRQLNAAL